MKKYFKPKSMTWWASLAIVGFGIYTKDVHAVLTGLAGIGIRGAIQE